MKRSPIKRLTALKRSGKPMKTKTRRRGNADAAGEFKQVVCAEPCIGARRCPICESIVDPAGHCAGCNETFTEDELVGGVPFHVCEPPFQAMHVVPKSILRARGLFHLVYDPTNGVCGCYPIHRRHDNGVEKIPRALLPERCLIWAEENGLMDVLERHWPGTPFDEEEVAA